MDISCDTIWNGSIRLWQPARRAGYRFNLDPILLAGFARSADRVLELGAGCGILGLLLLKAGKARHVTAVEVQPEMAALAVRNAEENGEAEHFEVHSEDLRSVVLAKGFDAVLFNPPYFKSGTGRPSPSSGRDIARHERHGTLESFVKCAATHLAPGGRLSAILPVSRADELDALCRAAGLTPSRRRDVHPRADEAPGHVLLEAVRQKSLPVTGSTDMAATVTREPPLVVHVGSEREYSPEVGAWLAGEMRQSR